MTEAPRTSVRLPVFVQGRSTDGQGAQDSVVVDLPEPSTNRFGFAWASDAAPPAPSLTTSRRTVSLSSSEGESDESEGETSPTGIQSVTDQSDGSDPTSSSRPLKSRQRVVDERADMGHAIPSLSRALTMPLPSELGHLQNPRRKLPCPSTDKLSSSAIDESGEHSQFHELSLELADSVQTMIQTLLQVSPPQVLDTTKEQFSACSLSVPTPSMSAMFTTMKNLNYISANMANFCSTRTSSGSISEQTPHNDFDIGEMLQSVGDALSGAAAQAGVDIVIFHGDVGLKHISVKGDESGTSYALSHIIRQIINSAQPGDSVEVGLLVGDGNRHSSSPPPGEPSSSRNSPAHDGPLRCTFEIAHKFSSDSPHPPGGTPEDIAPPNVRSPPMLHTLLLRRLLSQLDASLKPDLPPKRFGSGRVCELSFMLERGSPAPSPADETYQAQSNEPTLEDLLQFAETLRGKKVTLYASSKGSFAHHLTSYLTAWGMDVSHVSSELGEEGIEPGDEQNAHPAPRGLVPTLARPFGAPLDAFPGAPASAPPTAPIEGRPPGAQATAFIFIDDDVEVLRERLQKIRQELNVPLHTRKRPSLAAHHRPRSSPQVARAMGITPVPPSSAPSVFIVHFTSLANYKIVKDVIQSFLIVYPTSASFVPEIMIIPKPAGPRRFLTALHIAVNKPTVDPFFLPTATSPMSPGVHAASFFGQASASSNSSPRSPTTTSTGRPGGVSRTNSDRSARSPKENENMNHPLPSPLSQSDGMEYFSDAAVKLGNSPSSGLVIQSPDGQPAGIFFHPRAKGTRTPSSSSSVVMERDKAQLTVTADWQRGPNSRRPSGEGESNSRRPSAAGGMSFASFQQASAGTSPRLPIGGVEPERRETITPKPPVQRASSPYSEHHQPVNGGGMQGQASPASRRTNPMDTFMRKIGGTPPGSPLNETASASNPAPTRRATRRPGGDGKPPTPPVGAKKGNRLGDPNIVVPPISVLIVDDNPINQTILSTFMKKKKIKYDVAKNGEEAVQKWRTGGFHLILMDIQMPVMDGIAATKEIRRTERINAGAGYPPSPQLEGRTPVQTPGSDADSRSSASPYRSSVIIVALTASSLQSDRVAALAAGCNDFLTKPVSLLWLNNKIIEWGSIKALQMWADLRPEAAKSISTDQAAQARNVAQRLHVPEGRRTPTGSPSRSSSVTRNGSLETPTSATTVIGPSALAGRPSIAVIARGSSGSLPSATESTGTPSDKPIVAAEVSTSPVAANGELPVVEPPAPHPEPTNPPAPQPSSSEELPIPGDTDAEPPRDEHI